MQSGLYLILMYTVYPIYIVSDSIKQDKAKVDIKY